MSEARAEILASVRRALAARGTAPAAPEIGGYERQRELPTAARVELFAARLAEYGATVTQVEAPEVGAAAGRALASAAAGRVAIPADLPAAWRPAGIEAVVDDDLTAVELDALGAALSGCALAIAETGTIALDAGPGQGRRALTLLVDLHVCVVAASQLVVTVPEAFDRITGPSRPLTFVSGPSATSDIELSRVEGVHGPTRLHVIIADA